MDKFMNQKWNGNIDTNGWIFDYSLAYNILQDNNDFYGSDKVFKEIKNQQFRFDGSHLPHPFKFSVWKSSMSLRNDLNT